MNWPDERYVRLYTRDTTDWQALSFEAQGLFGLLLRKVDRAGVMDLGRHGKRGVAIAIGHPSRWRAVEPALDELIQDGCVVINGAQLVMPNYIAAQEAKASDKLRQQESRSRRRDLALRDVTDGGEDTEPEPESLQPAERGPVSQNVTDCHADSSPVTDGHTASHDVTPSRAVLSRAEPCVDRARTHDGSAPTAPDQKARTAVPTSPVENPSNQGLFAPKAAGYSPGQNQASGLPNPPETPANQGISANKAPLAAYVPPSGPPPTPFRSVSEADVQTVWGAYRALGLKAWAHNPSECRISAAAPVSGDGDYVRRALREGWSVPDLLRAFEGYGLDPGVTDPTRPGLRKLSYLMKPENLRAAVEAAAAAKSPAPANAAARKRWDDPPRPAPPPVETLNLPIPDGLTAEQRREVVRKAKASTQSPEAA